PMHKTIVLTKRRFVIRYFYLHFLITQTISTNFLFFFTDTAPTEIYTLSLHDALPIYATSLNSRFKSLDTLKVKIISVTFRRVIRTNHKKASKIWRHENIQLGGCQS